MNYEPFDLAMYIFCVTKSQFLPGKQLYTACGRRRGFQGPGPHPKNSFSRGRIQEFGQEGPAEFWPQRGALKIGVFPLKMPENTYYLKISWGPGPEGPLDPLVFLSVNSSKNDQKKGKKHWGCVQTVFCPTLSRIMFLAWKFHFWATVFFFFWGGGPWLLAPSSVQSNTQHLICWKKLPFKNISRHKTVIKFPGVFLHSCFTQGPIENHDLSQLPVVSCWPSLSWVANEGSNPSGPEFRRAGPDQTICFQPRYSWCGVQREPIRFKVYLCADLSCSQNISMCVNRCIVCIGTGMDPGFWSGGALSPKFA